MPSVRRLLLVAVCTYIGVIVLTGLFQAKLIYFPDRLLDLSPADVGLKFEDITLTTEDNVKISAWFVPRDGARATVQFFHGNAGNNADRLPELQTLNSLGLNVLIVDYRGYGKSEGSPTEQGTYLDAEAAWEHLTRTRGIAAETIAVMGESIGGAVAIELARRHRPGALIVQSTFTRLADVATVHYPLLPARLLLRHRYDSIDKVGHITCPKLFFHGAEDALVPLAMGRMLFEAAAEPKVFVQTPGDHNDGGFMYSAEYAASLRTFLDAAIPARAD